MVPLATFSVLAVLLSTGVECGYSSAGSSSSSNTDGSGHTFSQTSNNGQGTYTHSQQKPGGGGFTQTGNYPSNFNPGQVFGPSNFGQPGFGVPTYGPGFPYGTYGANTPQYTPFPTQQNFGFSAPFQPLPFQPVQPIQPFAPYQPLASPHDFNLFLNTLQQQYAAGGSVAQSTPGATAFASSYLGPTKYYKQQQDLLNGWKNSAFQPGYSGVPNYAYATGAYNPNSGFHQTAGVFPASKKQPNLDSRFDGPNDINAANVPSSGYVGVQTSSFSSSSDINGIKKHKEGASTTINDNGKVTTYTVEN